MAKTLIQLINDVGKNLRRSNGSTYTTLTDDGDAIFIHQAVNEGKRMVEAAWKWDVLRTEVTFNSVASTAEYDLGDAGTISSGTVAREQSYLYKDKNGRPQAWDVTSGQEHRLHLTTRDRAVHLRNIDAQDIDKPHLFAIYPNSDGLSLLFPYAPSGVRNYKLIIINPQAELTATSDVLTVAWRPVVLAATALAFDERGEELGGNSSLWWDKYEESLSMEMDRDTEAPDFQLVADTRYDAPDYWNA